MKIITFGRPAGNNKGWIKFEKLTDSEKNELEHYGTIDQEQYLVIDFRYDFEQVLQYFMKRENQ